MTPEASGPITEQMSRSSPIQTTQHPITVADIDEDAVKVLRRLNQFGHDAYLVGGGVRDLLLGVQPKDFDIVTSARPNEVRRLFRNCRLIGRRFRLAHILFSGGKIIECATFRAQPPSSRDGEVLITDDNEFGTPETDARRRDFTVNGLFFDCQSNQVIDFVGGLADLDRRVLRTIGEPGLRFKEDPVRMLRAVKFAGRLNLTIDTPDRQAIADERTELAKAAIPRLYEEVLRMLRGGGAERSYMLMEELGLLELLLPEISSWLSRPRVHAPWDPLDRMLAALDEQVRAGHSMEQGVLLATLFWPIYKTLVEDLLREPQIKQLTALAKALVAPTAARLRMPRRDLYTLTSVLEGQYRMKAALERRRRLGALQRSSNLPAMVDLLRMRTEAEMLPTEPLEFWQASVDEHEALRASRRDQDRPRRRRRR